MVSSFNQRFKDAIQDIPPQLAEATLSVLELAKNKTVNPELIFLTRALKALKNMAQNNYVSTAAYASTDLELFLTVLEEPDTLAILKKDDPLAAAKLRGIRAKAKLLEDCISDEEVSQILGVSRQSIAKARQKGQYFALPKGQTGYVYPLWQFNAGRPLSGIKDVLKALAKHDQWMQVSFMLSPNRRLDNKRPLDLLRAGTLDNVLLAASAAGKQGAS